MSTATEITFAERAEKLANALRTASRLVRFLDAEDLSEFLGYVQAEQDSPLTYAFVYAVKKAIEDPKSADALAMSAAGPRASVPDGADYDESEPSVPVPPGLLAALIYHVEAGKSLAEYAPASAWSYWNLDDENISYILTEAQALRDKHAAEWLRRRATGDWPHPIRPDQDLPWAGSPVE